MGLTTVILLGALAIADDTSTTAEAARHFETKVRPVLAERCYSCHGPKKQWGGLRVDRRESLLSGGDSGAAIVPGKPQESLLVRAIRHESNELKMPEGGKLDDVVIRDIERWIENGAVFPASSTPADERRLRDPHHWSYQPPVKHSQPSVQAAAWCRTWIDPFVLSNLEERQITPSRQADRESLLRRLTFDLTGLPPTEDVYQDFMDDTSVDATVRLVDRLLASPAYGERWGRHWLDVARYADSNGLDENIAHGNAWRYRDYVVRSFNLDKPFDQFVREQLAGDLLAANLTTPEQGARRNEALIATGFLSIGPKVLAEVDEAKMRMDIVDEQLDTTGRAFLAMTLGCARCHDHKFDPVSTADYYGLAGVFKSTKSMETYTKVARWKENQLALPEVEKIKADFAQRVTDRKTAIAMLVAQATTEWKQSQKPDEKAPEDIESKFPEATRTKLKQLRDELAAWEKEGPDLPSAMGVGEDTIVDLAIHVRGNPLKLSDVVARRVPQIVQGASPPTFAKEHSGRKELAEWLVTPTHPLTPRVIANRIWRWHFGRGIVRSTDNFGLLGERPSHSELLDALALRFVADGWSFKSMHRELVLSATYSQSGGDAATSAADPDNRWYSQFSLRRLEAEELRDALLAVSDQLDRQFGGSMLQVKNRGYLFDHTSIDKTDYTSRRRSLYLPVIRNNVYDVFQLLDFPDPAISSGDRAATVVAPQALLMMNSDLVMQSAVGLAERLQSAAGDDTARIRQLYVLAFARQPTPVEFEKSVAFLARAEGQLVATESDAAARRRSAWELLCHATLAANEFLYLR